MDVKCKTCKNFYSSEFPTFLYVSTGALFLYFLDFRLLIVILMGLLQWGVREAIAKITNAPRPCKYTGTCSKCAHCTTKSIQEKEGFPSGHTSTMFYFSTVYSAWVFSSLYKKEELNVSNWVCLRLFGVFALWGTSIWIASTRIKIKCHTRIQVCIGVFLGALYGILASLLIANSPWESLIV